MMNEDKPVDEFWSGVGIGVLFLFVVMIFVFFSPALLGLFSMVGAGSKGGMNNGQLGVALVFAGGREFI
jgi:hypothetical protein